MSEMPRPENFQQAVEITEEIPTQVTEAGSQAKAPAPKRNLFRRAALVLALLAGTATVAITATTTGPTAAISNRPTTPM